MNTQLPRLLRVARESSPPDLRKICARALSSVLPQNDFNRVRTLLLRAVGLRIGDKSSIAGALKITGPGSVPDLLSIGPGCHFTGPVHIDLMASVRIGAGVYVGYEVMFLTADHELGGPTQRCGRLVSGGIEVGDGAWIGSRAVILAGVRIGKGAVVAAGAIVTKDVGPNTMVGGVPAHFLRRLDDAAPSSTRRRHLSGTRLAALVEAVAATETDDEGTERGIEGAGSA
jgi:maltose O-acetyltransferase